MLFVVVIVVIVLLFYLKGKKAREREAEEREAEIAAAARKKAEREARLVNGNPVECMAVPEKESMDTEVTGPNGKTYYVPHYKAEKKFRGIYDPVYRLVVAEHKATEFYQSIKKGIVLNPHDLSMMVEYLVYAAEGYAYGTVTGEDLYQSERALRYLMEDRAQALEDEGYYQKPHIPVNIDKAISYYKMLDDLAVNHQDQINQLSESEIWKIMRAWAELGHLYGLRKNEKESRHYYDMGFRGVYYDERLQLDIIHAMMAGYPRDPRPYSNMLAAMAVDWVTGEKNPRNKNTSGLAACVCAKEYASFEKLDLERLAKSPGDAVAVYREGAEKKDAYCLYMLGRCALYGYGMTPDRDYGWQCLKDAAVEGIASAAILLDQLSVGDPESQAAYKQAYELSLEPFKNVNL